MADFKRKIIIFLIGATGYGMTEVAFRGYTHWSMAIAGGTILLILYAINRRFSGGNIILRAIAGGTVITAVEFAVGCIVNLWLGLGVWDYSDMPFNLLGQICLPFYFVWILVCVPAFALCNALEKGLGTQEENEATQ